MDVMQRSNSDKWLKAMKSEIESMKVNNVWTLVDEKIVSYKPIAWECEWTFLYFLPKHDISYFLFIRYCVLSFTASYFL